jgi:hypothetical protein
MHQKWIREVRGVEHVAAQVYDLVRCVTYPFVSLRTSSHSSLPSSSFTSSLLTSRSFLTHSSLTPHSLLTPFLTLSLLAHFLLLYCLLTAHSPLLSDPIGTMNNQTCAHWCHLSTASDECSCDSWNVITYEYIDAEATYHVSRACNAVVLLCVSNEGCVDFAPPSCD